MKSICVVTSTRADFGILKPLLCLMQKDPDLDLRLAVTGAHLLNAQGYTLREIQESGFQPDCCIPIQAEGDTPEMMSLTMANALTAFSQYFAKRRPDLLLVLGDRYEILAVCCAAVNASIPIGHIHGGETTEGAIDECYRHAITKMSYLHFTSCEAYRNRVIQLGEAPERVFNTGALGIDNMLHAPGASLEAVSQFVDMQLSCQSFCLVTFHPVTTEQGTQLAQMGELIKALDAFPQMQFVITQANTDVGGAGINQLWRSGLSTHPNWRLTASLGMERYVTALRNAACMIGNSSSGILEAPAASLPVVNIGSRQKGRLQAAGIINCQPDADSIRKAIAAALTEDARKIAAAGSNLFGDGHAAERIMGITMAFLKDGKLTTQKKFFNIKFEVVS